MEGILPDENKRRREKSFELIAISVYGEEEKELRVVEAEIVYVVMGRAPYLWLGPPCIFFHYHMCAFLFVSILLLVAFKCGDRWGLFVT